MVQVHAHVSAPCEECAPVGERHSHLGRRYYSTDTGVREVSRGLLDHFTGDPSAVDDYDAARSRSDSPEGDDRDPGNSHERSIRVGRDGTAVPEWYSLLGWWYSVNGAERLS